MSSIKLTEKQKEIVQLAIQTEKEVQQKIYFRYHNGLNKVYLIKIDNVTDDEVNVVFLKPINTKVSYHLEKKGVLTLEKINKNWNLLTLNPEVKNQFNS